MTRTTMRSAQLGEGSSGARAVLLALAARHRHLHGEWLRARAGGRVRRHLGRRLSTLERRFARLLEHSAVGEPARRAWRRHLRDGGPAPEEPHEGPAASLLFRGSCAASGSEVEVRLRPDGDCGVRIDGALVERSASEELAEDHAPITFSVGNEVFRETFVVPAEAFAAARGYFADPTGEPPWEHAPVLVAEGLVDSTFALTPRGRRALLGRGRGR